MKARFSLFDILVVVILGFILGYIKALIDLFKFITGIFEEDRDKTRRHPKNYHHRESKDWPRCHYVKEPEVSATYNFDDIVFSDRTMAQEVLNSLREHIIDYDYATVADFYDAANIPTQHVDYKYRWYDLDSAYLKRVPSGYVLNLPKPERS